MEDNDCEINVEDNFKDIYKKYKRKCPPPDLSNVVDFETIETDDQLRHLVQPYILDEPHEEPLAGLKPLPQWKAYCLVHNPGFIFIVNPFEDGYQKYWVKRCLQDFPCKPNSINLDAHMDTSTYHNIWDESGVVKTGDLQKDDLLLKLRWATLGYQYEWNTRVYDESKVQQFPGDLAYLTKYIAATLGYKDFHGQAGITNFYHMDSSLMAHVDYAEFDHDAPLVSFSFGQNCVFLIGGDTKAVEPVALFIKSGDICIMSKKARLSYHAVPRILPADSIKLDKCFQQSVVKKRDCESFPVVNGTVCNGVERLEQEGRDFTVSKLNKSIEDCVHDIEWKPFRKYLEVSRINLNVRQVLKPGDTGFPAEPPSHPSAKPCKNKTQQPETG